MHFQALARPQCFRVNGEKSVNFANKVCYPISHSGSVPTGHRNFTDTPKIPGCLLQRKCEGTDVWMWVCLSSSEAPF